jgi:di/tricarboxylate transporter
MGSEAWITLTTISLVVVLLVATRRAPDVIIWGGVALLMIAPVPGPQGLRLGVLSASEALAGLANEGAVAVGLLFVMAAGIETTGAMTWLGQRMLGRPRSLASAQARIMLPTSLMSAFFNNTPLVATLMPVVGDWARKRRQSVSMLLLPLSYASILGGACTLIGTSTNLIANGWLVEHTNLSGLGMFELAWLGVPALVVGFAWVLLTSRWLLPDRLPPIAFGDDARQYTVEMLLPRGSPLAGKTIEEAGLRHLPGLYLVEISREDQVLPAVSPRLRLREEDRLVFAGVVDSVVDLRRIHGLVPATNQIFKLHAGQRDRCLVEAVVSDACPLVGRTIREGRFRGVYNAAVIAIARNGARIDSRIGDVRLQAGDTLLLETRPSFAEQQRDRRDFYLVSRVEGSTPPQHERAPVALAILAALILVVALRWLDMVQAAAVGAGLMLMTRCCTATAARRTIDWQVLLVMTGALGLGKAMQTSGLASTLGTELIGLAGDRPVAVLAILYGISMVVSCVVTAKAGVLLVLPIALAASQDLDVSFLPFAVAVTFAGATTIATPIGYPTNLMVLGPGGYRFGDYLRFGGPLALALWGLAVLLIPMFWGFARP